MLQWRLNLGDFSLSICFWFLKISREIEISAQKSWQNQQYLADQEIKKLHRTHLNHHPTIVAFNIILPLYHPLLTSISCFF
jgi:hypothetical protein